MLKEEIELWPVSRVYTSLSIHLDLTHQSNDKKIVSQIYQHFQNTKEH